jgi:dTDP-4-dehydrorhamnose reductase
MKIHLIGNDGQVGWALLRALAPLGEVIDMGPKECDLGNHEQLRSVVESVGADIVVNAGAYTAVDKAETNGDLASRINGSALRVIGEVAKRRGALVVHYSTDYVYDGAKSGRYVETDLTGPLGVYGTSKLAGDQALQASGCAHLIFRTSWVFSAFGSNFAKTMLRLARERDTLNVVADQVGAPTAADLIADTTALCLQTWLQCPHRRTELSGLYHLVAAGETSWYDYARYVIEFARARGVAIKVAADAIKPIPTSAYPTPARRPANSRLDVSKLETTFGLKMPDWTVHLSRVMSELLGCYA